MEGEVSVVDASTLCNRASGESRTPPGMPAGVAPTPSPDMPTVAAAGAAAEEKGSDEATKGKPAAAGGATGGGANLLEMLSRAAGSVDGSEEEKEKEVNEPAAEAAAPPAGWNGPGGRRQVGSDSWAAQNQNVSTMLHLEAHIAARRRAPYRGWRGAGWRRSSHRAVPNASVRRG